MQDEKDLDTAVAGFIYESWARWSEKDNSLLEQSCLHGAGPLYEILDQIQSNLCLFHDRHRRDLGLPTAKPLWSYTEDVLITSTKVLLPVRWRGYRCDEDEDDEDRPPKEVAPFMRLEAVLTSHHVCIALTALPSGETKEFPFPLYLVKHRFMPILLDLVKFAWVILDQECVTNALVALRPGKRLRSGKFVNQLCPCGPKAGHLFL